MVNLWGYDISPFLWFCAAGKAFFFGVELLVFAILFSAFHKKAWSNLVIYLLTTTSVFLIVLSATPLALWFYALWTIAVLIFLFFVAVRTPRTLKFLGYCRIVGLCFCVIALLIESPFHLNPAMPTGKFERLYIIGDSISAGIGGREEQTWPRILRRKYSVDVVDLSVPGATVTSAIDQAVHVDSQNSIVLLEIGGNDFFAPTPHEVFEQNLRQILEKTSDLKRVVIMLELPLQPWHIHYGKIQRKLAKQFDATLIPKDFLASILAQEGATVDLAHLSSDGHELMAEKTWSLLGQCLLTGET